MSQAKGPIAVTYRFEIEESGSFLDKTFNEMGTPEAAAMIAAACTVFQMDCTKEAVAAAEVIKEINTSHNVIGEEHSGIIRAPVNYEICKARIDWGNASIDGESTFNTRIVRELHDNGLGFYAVVPKHRPEPHWIRATLYLLFVPSGSIGQYGCFPTNVNPWLAKGPTDATFYPGAHL